MQSKDRNFLIIRSFSLKWAIAMIFFIILSNTSYSQGPGGDPGGDPDLIPIDGGLGFLLAAGVGYGIKKAKDLRKKG